MNVKIDAAWNKYNANSQNKNVGDCVKRALSFAYGMDYNEVGRQLNRIKNAIGSIAYNYRRTYERFLKDKGAVLLPKSEYEGLTEDEFAEKHPQGVYILLTGTEKSGHQSHMVCIFNGDIIDSWNSSDYVVYDGWKIPNVSTEISSVEWDDISEDMNNFIDEYLASLNKKYEDWFNAWREPGYQVDLLTYRMKFYVRTNSNLPDESQYYSNKTYMKRIVVKMNPRMSEEANLSTLQKKLKQSVYDWLYPFMKDRKDTQAILKMNDDEALKKKDTWTKKQLLMLPEWVRPLVEYFWYDTSGSSYTKYEIRFKALPDDPYVEDEGNKIRYETDSYKDLKDMLAAYKEDFTRPSRW